MFTFFIIDAEPIVCLLVKHCEDRFFIVRISSTVREHSQHLVFIRSSSAELDHLSHAGPSGVTVAVCLGSLTHPSSPLISSFLED